MILGGFSDERIGFVGEGDPRRGDAISLIVGYDLHLTIIGVDSHTGICGPEIDTNYSLSNVRVP